MQHAWVTRKEQNRSAENSLEGAHLKDIGEDERQGTEKG
jgi:hypothetical protein